MRKMDSSLILGIIVLVLGTAFGTYLIHLSNRKANTARIEALEATFTEQNKKLKKQSTSIENLSSENNKISSQILKVSEKLNNTTLEISEISKSVQEIAKSNNQLVQLNNEISNNISNEQKEKGSFNLEVQSGKGFVYFSGSNKYIIGERKLEMGLNLSMFANWFDVFLQKKEHELLITTKVVNKQGELILDISKSQWALDKSKTFSINYDKKGLEIIDNNGLIIFQIILKDERIEASGIRYLPEGVVVFSPTSTSILGFKSKDFEKKFSDRTKEIKPIFRHVGKDYLGTRLEN